MEVKKSAKTYCQFCKKVLSKHHEKKLNYHKSCYDTIHKFENIHEKIKEQLAIDLGLTEDQIVEFIKNKNLIYSLNDNMKIYDLKISNTKLSTIKLSASYLDELQNLSIENVFSHEEWMDNRDPSWKEREGVIYKSDPGLTKLPESIGELKNLRIVSLSGNSIKNFPESILRLDNLRELTLEANDLEIHPEIITKLTTLETLNLSYNPLRTLPDSFVNLSNLKKLIFNFECTNVRFNLPNNFGDLPKLEELRILSCQGPNLIWSFPDSFAKLNALRVLEITGPDYKYARYLRPDPLYPFTFKLPSNFGFLSKLEELRLIYCHLEPLPASFSNLKTLQILDISDDSKYFINPKAFEFFPNNLKELNLERNVFKTIPHEIEKLTKLQKLNLEGNKITSISTVIINLKNLHLLNIKYNPVASANKYSKLVTAYLDEMQKKTGLIIEK